MKMPYEIIVWYLLPALRKQLVIELKSSGMPQKTIAKKLHITEAAISQYLHNKRGSKNIKLGTILTDEIKKSTKTIKDSNDNNIAERELVRLVRLSHKEKTLCPKCKIKDGKCNICTGL